MHVKVAIIGAGSAGLSALRQVRQITGDFVLLDGRARFLDVHRLQVADAIVEADHIVIAAGMDHLNLRFVGVAPRIQSAEAHTT